ncbi:MAG: PPOX class F420-dependent oxidoreductase [Chloroflexota bacterium]|nr:PPOX class F420-dependent oxidoreductase [Chloroflexota bacterium]
MRQKITPGMRAFLSAVRFGVVGTTNPDGSPHLTVMWYLFEDDDVVFNTSRARVKARNLERDPRASFVVHDQYTFVRIDGRVTAVSDRATAQDDIRRMAIRYHGREKAEEMVRDQFSKEERISYRLDARRVYAQGL